MTVVYVARCPQHGLHGCRDTCFECDGPVEQVPMVEVKGAASMRVMVMNEQEAELVRREGGEPVIASTEVERDLLRHGGRICPDCTYAEVVSGDGQTRDLVAVRLCFVHWVEQNLGSDYQPLPWQRAVLEEMFEDADEPRRPHLFLYIATLVLTVFVVALAAADRRRAQPGDISAAPAGARPMSEAAFTIPILLGEIEAEVEHQAASLDVKRGEGA